MATKSRVFEFDFFTFPPTDDGPEKPITLRSDQHLFIAGRTGTGKTFLGRKIACHFPYVVIHDTKGTTDFPEVPKEKLAIVTRLENLPSVRKPYIIYRPRWEELNMDFYNAFYQWVYRRQNTVVVVDELMSVCPTPLQMPEYLKAIYTRGRERNTAAIGCTQRPSGIPQICISEASHLFVLDLNLRTDRDKMALVSGMDQLFRRPGKRAFWYVDVADDFCRKATLVVQKGGETVGEHSG